MDCKCRSFTFQLENNHATIMACTVTITHIHPFNGPFSGTTWVGQYEKGKTNLDCTEARDSEWQWHQLGHMQVCTSLQTEPHHSSFLQAGCSSCHPTNSVKALKALNTVTIMAVIFTSYTYSVLAVKSRLKY